MIHADLYVYINMDCRIDTYFMKNMSINKKY